MDMDEYRWERYKVYLQERNSLYGLANEQITKFDNNMLLLAAGSFGVTIAFYGQLAGPNAKLGIPLLIIIAWVFFAMSIISTMISLIVSHNVIETEIQIRDIIYENSIRTEGLPLKELQNRFAKLPSCFNYVSLGAFILGIAFLLQFVFSNRI